MTIVNQKKYWLRGTLVAGLIWIILLGIWGMVATIRDADEIYPKHKTLLKVIELVLSPINLSPNGGAPHGVNFVILVFPLLEWLMGGATIGYLYGKIKNNDNVME